MKTAPMPATDKEYEDLGHALDIINTCVMALDHLLEQPVEFRTGKAIDSVIGSLRAASDMTFKSLDVLDRFRADDI